MLNYQRKIKMNTQYFINLNSYSLGDELLPLLLVFYDWFVAGFNLMI